MKLLLRLLVIALIVLLGWKLLPQRSIYSSNSHIYPIENTTLRPIGNDVYIVALLPQALNLQISHKTMVVKTSDLGIATSPNMRLKLNSQKLQKTLQNLGADEQKSLRPIIVTVRRGGNTVRLVPKPKPIARPAPPVATAPTPVPQPVAPVTPQPTKPVGRNITYCVRLNGVDPSNLPAFEAKLAAVYNDPRGWSLGGVNSFTEVTSGCRLVVWLSAAELVPTYGSICDSMWSCTVYPNVIINFDRWLGASDAWNGGGGNLDDYRSMVINHETGHWFGFNHRYCSGAGQLAPVMQQQSISLQGCAPNPWPLSYEKAAL